jgi:ferredoxin-NADP reductase
VKPVRSLYVPILRQNTVAKDTVEVALDVSAVDFRYQAGQYVRITLPGLEDYPLPEQFHDFSISSSPLDTSVLTFTYRESSSAYKSKLKSLESGSQILLEGPFGILTLPEQSDQPVNFVAIGIGITPMFSMIRFSHGANQSRGITLYYFNSSRETAAYVDELENLSKQNLRIVVKYFYGHFADELKRLTSSLPEGLWYITGPPEAVAHARSGLVERGILDRDIRVEEFTGSHG